MTSKPLDDLDLEIVVQILRPWMEYLKELLGTTQTIEHEKYAAAAQSTLAEARKQLRVGELREALKVTLHMAEHMRGDLRVKYQKLLAETEPTP